MAKSTERCRGNRGRAERRKVSVRVVDERVLLVGVCIAVRAVPLF